VAAYAGSYVVNDFTAVQTVAVTVGAQKPIPYRPGVNLTPGSAACYL